MKGNGGDEVRLTVVSVRSYCFHLCNKINNLLTHKIIHVHIGYPLLSQWGGTPGGTLGRVDSKIMNLSTNNLDGLWQS